MRMSQKMCSFNKKVVFFFDKNKKILLFVKKTLSVFLKVRKIITSVIINT